MDGVSTMLQAAMESLPESMKRAGAQVEEMRPGLIVARLPNDDGVPMLFYTTEQPEWHVWPPSPDITTS